MSGQHRDTVLAKILASSKSLSPAQMGAMIANVCLALGGKAAGAKSNNISRNNLDAMINQILACHASCSPAQIAAMIYGLVHALGAISLTAQHREVLVTHIRKSGHLPDIVSALKLISEGEALLAFLHL